MKALGVKVLGVTGSADGLNSRASATDAQGVSLPPDDLPRSPTGRVPQWVLDEAAGVPVGTEGWRGAAPASAASGPRPGTGAWDRPRRRRRAPAIIGVVVAAALGGAWWLTGGASGLPAKLTAVLQGHVEPPPSAEVVALADSAQLSAAGRDLFYGADPQILDAQAFAGKCTKGQSRGAVAQLPDAVARQHSAVATGTAVGCFDQGANSIVLYEPADPRLQGYVVETAAHETLHAAWAQLSAGDQATLTPLLEAAVAPLAADDPIQEQITGSVGTHPENRPTELFAYVGTQVWHDGGLDPQLEAVYSRFVTDRAALVAVHAAWLAVLDGLDAEIQTASQVLAAQESANAQHQAQYTADSGSLDYYRKAYQNKVAEVAAMSTSERERLQLSWVWWDGTKLPMAPADQTLAAAADLLARDDAALPAREATIQAETAAAAAARTRVEGLVANLKALHAQLDPTTPAG